MQILLVIGSVIAAIIVLFLVIAVFVKRESAVQREIIIHQPRQVVYDYVRFLRNQDHYSKWVMTDPAMKKEFRGTDGTVGFVYGWDGNKKAGAGEQEIIGLAEGFKVDIEVRFIRPFASVGKTPMTLETVNDNGTKVFWGMSTKMPYPFNALSFFMQGVLGRDLEISLQNLKRILENK